MSSSNVYLLFINFSKILSVIQFVINDLDPLMDDDAILWKIVSKRILKSNKMIPTYIKIYKYIYMPRILNSISNVNQRILQTDEYRSTIYLIYFLTFRYNIYRSRSSTTHLHLNPLKKFTTLRLYIFTIACI